MEFSLGNVTLGQLQDRLGFTLSKRDENWFERRYEPLAKQPKSGTWHCFDVPNLNMVFSDRATFLKAKEKLKAYTLKGSLGLSYRPRKGMYLATASVPLLWKSEDSFYQTVEVRKGSLIVGILDTAGEFGTILPVPFTPHIEYEAVCTEVGFGSERRAFIGGVELRPYEGEIVAPDTSSDFLDVLHKQIKKAEELVCEYREDPFLSNLAKQYERIATRLENIERAYHSGELTRMLNNAIELGEAEAADRARVLREISFSRY